MSDREIMDAKNGIMARKSYGFRDPVVKNVVDKFVSRSDVGYEKYGSTLDDERRLKMKGLQKYLNDIQEELKKTVRKHATGWYYIAGGSYFAFKKAKDKNIVKGFLAWEKIAS